MGQIDTSQYLDVTNRNEQEIAEMYDGVITLVAVVRCGQHCGQALNIYPDGEPMTQELAAAFIPRYGWQQHQCQTVKMWLCSECASALTS